MSLLVAGGWCSTLLFLPALCPHTPGESWVKHWLTVYRPSSQPDSNSTSLVSISMFVWVPLCLLDPCPLKHTHSSVVLSPSVLNAPMNHCDIQSNWTALSALSLSLPVSKLLFFLLRSAERREEVVQADRVGLYCAEVGERGQGGGMGWKKREFPFFASVVR